MIVYKNYVTFSVLGEEINLISDDTDYGQTTFAELGGKYFYCGQVQPSISTAIFAWQDVFGREITMQELHQVMVDNQLSSETT
jgi:hypothetical protein